MNEIKGGMEDRRIGYGRVYTMVMTDTRLSAHTKALYSYLKSLAGNKDKCWPKYTTIEKDLKISRPTIRKGLQELQNAGYLNTKRTKYNSYEWLDKQLHNEISKVNEVSPKVKEITPKVKEINLSLKQEHEQDHQQDDHVHDHQETDTKPMLGHRFGSVKEAEREKKKKKYVQGCVYRNHDTIQYFVSNYSIEKDKLHGYLNEFITDSTAVQLDSLNSHEVCTMFKHWHKEKYHSTITEQAKS